MLGQLNNGVAGAGHVTNAQSLSYTFNIVDLYELINTPSHKKNLLPVLDKFIWSQAALHHSEYEGDTETLADNLERRGNTLRGVLVYSKDKLPVAYAVYYPMVNGNGERGNYLEDAFVTESFRRHGVMPIVFHELAKRCVDEGAQFLQWSTDKRNTPFQNLSAKIGAHKSDISTFVTTDLLDRNYTPVQSLCDAWKQTKFVSIPITGNHVNAMRSIGVTPDIIRKTGDIDFKGFVTFDTSDMTKIIAVTPGWPHMSTFKQKHGIYLECTNFSEQVCESDKESIIISCAKAAQEYAKNNDFEYFKWHLKMDSVAYDLIKNKLNFSVDTMAGTPESEMEVYTLQNGKLLAIANQNHSNVVNIPVNKFGNG